MNGIKRKSRILQRREKRKELQKREKEIIRFILKTQKETIGIIPVILILTFFLVISPLLLIFLIGEIIKDYKNFFKNLIKIIRFKNLIKIIRKTIYGVYGVAVESPLLLREACLNIFTLFYELKFYFNLFVSAPVKFLNEYFITGDGIVLKTLHHYFFFGTSICDIKQKGRSVTVKFRIVMFTELQDDFLKGECIMVFNFSRFLTNKFEFTDVLDSRIFILFKKIFYYRSKNSKRLFENNKEQLINLFEKLVKVFFEEKPGKKLDALLPGPSRDHYRINRFNGSVEELKELLETGLFAYEFLESLFKEARIDDDIGKYLKRFKLIESERIVYYKLTKEFL